MMKKISIDLQGSDSAHYNNIMRLESRLFQFPDGLQRHITLRLWYWQTWEMIKKEFRFYDQDLARESYEMAVKWSKINGTPFEDEIRDCFSILIEQSMSLYNEKQFNIVNENSALKRV